MPDHNVLHREPLGDLAEESTTVDGEPEVVGVDVGCSQPGEMHDGFAGGHHVGIQRDGPLIVGGLDLVPLPKAALNVFRPELGAELSPDFLFAWTEHFSQRVHGGSVISDARSAAERRCSVTRRQGCPNWNADATGEFTGAAWCAPDMGVN